MGMGMLGLRNSGSFQGRNLGAHLTTTDITANPFHSARHPSLFNFPRALGKLTWGIRNVL